MLILKPVVGYPWSSWSCDSNGYPTRTHTPSEKDERWKFIIFHNRASNHPIISNYFFLVDNPADPSNSYACLPPPWRRVPICVPIVIAYPPLSYARSSSFTHFLITRMEKYNSKWFWKSMHDGLWNIRNVQFFPRVWVPFVYSMFHDALQHIAHGWRLLGKCGIN